MQYYIGNVVYSDSLSHFGIKGMRWGFRRFQNPDGSWTEAGKKRYGRRIENMRDKDVQKYMDTKAKNNVKMKNFDEARRRLREEAQNSKELNEESRMIDEMMKKGSVDDKRFDRVMAASEAKRKELKEKYVDEFASAFLKDLDFEDTQAGRDYVKKHGNQFFNVSI